MTSVELPPGWEEEFNSTAGIPDTVANVEVENAWWDEEHGSSGISGGYDQGGEWNLFDTTLPMPAGLYGGVEEPASTTYNSVGVQNYNSLAQGIAANVETLEEPYYTTFLADLRAGKDTLAQLEEAEDATPWGTAFTSPSNTPWAVPGSSGANVSGVTLTDFPGGSNDPLNWPSEIAGAAGSAASSSISSALSSILAPVGVVLLKLTLTAIGGGLVVVGLWVTTARKPQVPLLAPSPPGGGEPASAPAPATGLAEELGPAAMAAA